MLNRLQKSKDDEGFTLIELLVVVVIIGVLAAIAIPIFLSQKEKAADAGVKSDLKNASTYLETLFVDKSSYAEASTYLPSATSGYKSTTNNTITASGDATSYCIQGKNSGSSKTFVLRSADGVVKEVGVAGVTACTP